MTDISFGAASTASADSPLMRARRLRVAGIAALVGSGGFVLAFVAQSVVAIVWPQPDFLLPAEAPGFARTGIVIWIAVTLFWSLGFLIAVTGINRLAFAESASDRSFLASVVRPLGVLGAGALAFTAGQAMSQTGSFVTPQIADAGADEGAQRAVIAGSFITNNGFGFAATLLLAVWVVGAALGGRRGGAHGAGILLLAILSAALTVTAAIVLGFPTLGLFMLYFVTVGIVFLIRSRRLARTANVSLVDNAL